MKSARKFSIKYYDYFKDHSFLDKPVLPAVEALNYLAESVLQTNPDIDINFMKDANFKRFLSTESQETIEAFAEFEEDKNRIKASLLTKKIIQKSGMSRKIEHVDCVFGQFEKQKSIPLDHSIAALGIGITISSEQMYGEMVPFGPAYHNAVGNIFFSPNGATGFVHATKFDGTSTLGSPFPFDASMHVACAWGQRYANILTFPVGFKKRIIHKKTQKGKIYFCRVFPVNQNEKELLFNVQLFTKDGELYESIYGLLMSDISRGKLTPPSWFIYNKVDALENLKQNILDLAVIEIDSIAPFFKSAFSAEELKRSEKMGEKRLKSFAAARIALKQLARKFVNTELEAPQINTVYEKLPVCPNLETGENHFCSASHNKRFAIAVASQNPVGVDVETISAKVQKGKRLYLTTEEKLKFNADNQSNEFLTKIWTIKEAASKMTGIPLAKAWSRIKVKKVGENISLAELCNTELLAKHTKVDDSIFTVITKHELEK